MDYTFGLDADALAEFGAKAVVFDAIREVDKNIRIHPYIKVPPAMPPQEGRVAACRASDASYFVVRASSRYELCPGTAGMTRSKRYVNPEIMEGEIENVREPTDNYRCFCSANGLEPESVLPVIIQPMWADSYGMVTSHPNQDLVLVDYYKGHDSDTKFKKRSPWSSGAFAKLDAAMARFDGLVSMAQRSGADTFFARYDSSGLLSGKFGENSEHQAFMDLAETLFRILCLDEYNLFGPDMELQIEFGPDPSTKDPILYQSRPFMKRQRAATHLDGTNADMVFGICGATDMPVVRVKSGIDLGEDDFEGDEYSGAKGAYRLATQLGERDVTSHIRRAYQTEMIKKASARHKKGFCLAMRTYNNLDDIDFTTIHPQAVVIEDRFRSGMLHNRTNLIQSVPVVIFGNNLYDSKSKKARIVCDGVNASVEQL